MGAISSSTQMTRGGMSPVTGTFFESKGPVLVIIEKAEVHPIVK